VYVSTEDAEIAAIARRFGADIPYIRPIHLADDHAGVVDVGIDLLQFLEKRKETYETVCLSDPSSPLLTAEDFRHAFIRFQHSGSDILHAVCAFEHPPQRSVSLEGDLLRPMYSLTDLRKKSQELQPAYRIIGGIHFIRTEFLLKHQTWHSENMVGYEVSRDRAVDIDTAHDLQMAEFLMQTRWPSK
jgi:CMP-N-acetylneuraminic acid synthetase